ncbi:hypothetical protein AUC61_23985 [Pseudomonas sp. S25]|uniref:Uncharacterized protein n=1 Tax=Pseudomonas maioricensis TaxID=1766623 RepID=A0ABS9ZQZ1_9PSED|nr:hypothetical protein [Pseudomonas quasicaspiana]MCD5980552.1 hypothetical protein [Pseudomonas quasicaspiana]MCI8212596.1 hypothetical protein [Pseudomonas sp. S25]
MNESPDPSAVFAKATPPAAYVGAQVLQIPIETWISVLTVVYLVLAISTLIFPGWRSLVASWWRKWRK